MSTPIKSLIAVFGARLSEFQKGVNQAIDLTIRLRDVSRNAFRDISAAAEQTGRGIQNTFSAVEKTATRSGLAIVAAMTATSVAVGKTGFEFLKLKRESLIAFETVLGSGEKAQRLMEDLSRFAAQTPFELPGLIDAGQKFLAFGLEAKKIIPTMRAVGDAVAGLGGDPEKMNRIVIALGQMKARTKVLSGEMLQLTEVGIPAWQALADVLGVSIPQAQEMAEKGMIKTDKIFDAFVAKIGSRFDGLMGKISGTLGGLTSTAMDNFRETAAEIFEPLYVGAERFLQWAMGPTGLSMEGVTARLRETVRGISKDVFLFLQKNGQSAIERIGEAFVAFGGAVRNGISYLRQHGNAIMSVVRSMFDWTLAIGRFMAEHPRLMAALVAMKVLMMTGLPGAIATTVGGLAKLALELWQINTLLRLAFGTGLVSAMASAGRAAMTLAAQFEILKGTVTWLQGLTLFSGWATAAGRLSIAVAAVTAAVKLLIGSIVILLGYSIVRWAAGFIHGKDLVNDMNDALEKSISLTEELILLRERMAGREISLAIGRQDIEKAKKALDALEKTTAGSLGDKQKELAKLNRVRNLELTPEESRERIKKGKPGNFLTNDEWRQIDELEKEIAGYEETLRGIQKARVEIAERQKAEDQAKADAGGEDKKPDAPPDDTDPTKAKKLTPEERRRQTINRHEDKSAEKSDPLLKGFSEIMKMIDSGATVDEIEEFIRDIEGMTPEIVAKVMEKVEAAKAQREKNVEERSKALEGMKAKNNAIAAQDPNRKAEMDAENKRLDALAAEDIKEDNKDARDLIGEAVKEGITEANTTVRGEKRGEDTENDAFDSMRRAEGLPKEEVASFNRELEELRQAFIKGEISEKEYERGLDEIRDRIQKASQAMDAMRDAEREFDEISQGNAVPEFAARFDELNQQLKQGEITVEEYRRAMGLLQGDMKAERDAEQSMAKMKVEGVDPMFLQQYEDLLAKLRNGAITLDDFRNAMGTLEQQIRASQEAGDTFRRIMEGTFGQTFGYGSQAVGQLQSRIDALKQALSKGSLSVDDFNREMKKLETQAEKAAEAERQRRLLAGDFIGAGLDPQKALQERLASARMNQFNQMIDNMANQILGIGGQFQTFADGLNHAGQSAMSFAENMPGSRDVGNWWGQLQNFMQTIEGQRQMVLGQIQLFRQSLQLTADAFTQRDLQAKIDDLIRQLQVLDQQQANLPTFVGDRGEFDFNDPGLEESSGSASNNKGASGGGKGGGVTFSLPNVTRITQTEAQVLAETVSREAQRRGRRI